MGDTAAEAHSQPALPAESPTIVVAVVDGVAGADVPGVDALVALVAVTVARMGVWAALCSTAVAEKSRTAGRA